MDYQPLPLEWAYRLVNFGPLVLVSTTDGRKANVCTVAWCAPCAKKPPTVAISIGKRHKTYKNIMKTGFFGLNIPTADQLPLAWYCGKISGNSVDKIADRGIELFYGSILKTLPLLKACSAWLECKIVPGAEAGDHGIIVAQVVSAGCRAGAVNEQYNWQSQAFPTLHHLGGRSFAVSGKVIEAATETG